MDLVSIFRDNVGGLVVGGLWLAYVFSDKAVRDRQERKQQADSVKGAGSLIDQLNTSLQNAITLATGERERADKLAEKVSNLSVEVGQLKTALQHAEAHKERMEKELEQTRMTVEQLVVEARNKDKSISELVALNRKILKTMGADLPAAPSAQQEQ